MTDTASGPTAMSGVVERLRAALIPHMTRDQTWVQGPADEIVAALRAALASTAAEGEPVAPHSYQDTMAHGIGVSPPLSASPTEGEPVAWRVKDYADGWILCHRKDEAVGALGGTAAIIEPLYRHPPASPVAGTDDPGSLDNPALMAYGDDPRIDRHMDAYQYGGDKPVAGEGEDNAAYNAGVIHALEQELISTYARERFGKLPMWARLLVNDLIKRIANLRAKLAKPVAGEGMERDFRQRGEARPEVKK